MSIAVWVASLPGVAVGGLIAYVSQRRLQSTERAWMRKAELYSELTDCLHQHNRDMWQRLLHMTPHSEPFPPILATESSITQRTDIFASDKVQIVLGEVLAGILDWRECDEKRFEREPRIFLGDSDLFGERWQTPQDEFIVAGESVENSFYDLRKIMRAELGDDRPRSYWLRRRR